MPQNNRNKQIQTPAELAKPTSKQQGQAAPQPSSKAAESDSACWQRGQGGFSGRAKKDYLKWKRQQKAAAASEDDSSDFVANEGSSKQDPSMTVGASSTSKQAPFRPTSSTDAAATSATKGTYHTWQVNATDDPSLPLHYRPLVSVPAVPFSSAEHPVGQLTAAANAGECVFMPRLNPAEVGFTLEGFELDMPTRPHWQGVVSSAEELHALEEQQFAAWQASLLQKAPQPTEQQLPIAAAGQQTADTPHQQQQQQGSSRAGGVGRLSYYEGRLDFWRQLWRTLEMSDIVLMIVDARNPLLHFSHALYRHIIHDHKLPLILILNKCDLIPAAAAAAWQQWLQQQLPGVQVVLISAAEGQEAAAAAARAVVRAVFDKEIERGGQQVKVEDFVGMSVDELLEASYIRNTHAKRQVMQHGAAAAAAAITKTDTHQADEHTGCSDALDDIQTMAGAEAGSADNDSDGDWSLKPSRLAKKAGKKAGGRAKGRQRQQQQQLLQQQLADRQTGGETHDVLGQHSNVHDIEPETSSDSETEIDEAAARLQSLTVEHRLSSSFISGSVVHAGAAGAGDPTADADSDRQHGITRDDSSSRSWADDDRPVVIGLLGEPNVGKSSTLNTLLGAHRVAVSCHPGRTKHYQTHFMSDNLVLCDCPGLVFPRLDVSLPMQVLFGSYPIASCRQPYAVVRYLAEASWPRIHTKLGLKPQQPQQQERQYSASGTGPQGGSATSQSNDSSGAAAAPLLAAADGWSPWELCEALAENRRWVLPRSGRLDTYRAANWLLRAALGGREGLGLAFLPPEESLEFEV